MFTNFTTLVAVVLIAVAEMNNGNVGSKQHRQKRHDELAKAVAQQNPLKLPALIRARASLEVPSVIEVVVTTGHCTGLHAISTSYPVRLP